MSLGIMALDRITCGNNLDSLHAGSYVDNDYTELIKKSNRTQILQILSHNFLLIKLNEWWLIMSSVFFIFKSKR